MADKCHCAFIFNVRVFNILFIQCFQMNINPEDLIPKLPKPRDLQPFPTVQAIVRC